MTPPTPAPQRKKRPTNGASVAAAWTAPSAAPAATPWLRRARLFPLIRKGARVRGVAAPQATPSSPPAATVIPSPDSNPSFQPGPQFQSRASPSSDPSRALSRTLSLHAHSYTPKSPRAGVCTPSARTTLTRATRKATSCSRAPTHVPWRSPRRTEPSRPSPSASSAPACTAAITPRSTCFPSPSTPCAGPRTRTCARCTSWRSPTRKWIRLSASLLFLSRDEWGFLYPALL
mmetsp:Transcript_23625/g.74238  ORF Transcript_23625/g.74238 Transcript_23625/m.74238 type:complete len:232 (-) Transcript_23625:32-727(-)